MTPERLMSLASAKGLSIDHIPGGGRPEWTAQETAMAIAGLPADIRDACYAAYAYRWARDDSQHSVLYSKLSMAVWGASDSMASRERWPSRIREQKYMERLVRMAILEERCWFLINQYSLWPAILIDDGFQHMDDELWERRLSRKYEAVRGIIESWCSTVHYHALARIDPYENALSTTCA